MTAKNASSNKILWTLFILALFDSNSFKIKLRRNFKSAFDFIRKLKRGANWKYDEVVFIIRSVRHHRAVEFAMRLFRNCDGTEEQLVVELGLG